jgi:hypothetical protein
MNESWEFIINLKLFEVFFKFVKFILDLWFLVAAKGFPDEKLLLFLSVLLLTAQERGDILTVHH